MRVSTILNKIIIITKRQCQRQQTFVQIKEIKNIKSNKKRNVRHVSYQEKLYL